MNDKDLTIQGIVMPAVSAAQAVEAWKQYQDLKTQIVDKEVDVQLIEGKEFLKKSYWRKVATFFNLSVEVLEEKREQIGKTFVWHFTCKAIAPNGRFAVGVGSCDAFEKSTLKDGKYVRWNKFSKKWEDATPNSIHNIRSTAETRAFNRAVSNLVGGGEVSAEEVEQINGEALKAVSIKQESQETEIVEEAFDNAEQLAEEVNRNL
jgi:hypothetical protein